MYIFGILAMHVLSDGRVLSLCWYGLCSVRMCACAHACVRVCVCVRSGRGGGGGGEGIKSSLAFENLTVRYVPLWNLFYPRCSI